MTSSPPGGGRWRKNAPILRMFSTKRCRFLTLRQELRESRFMLCLNARAHYTQFLLQKKNSLVNTLRTRGGGPKIKKLVYGPYLFFSLSCDMIRPLELTISMRIMCDRIIDIKKEFFRDPYLDSCLSNASGMSFTRRPSKNV